MARSNERVRLRTSQFFTYLFLVALAIVCVIPFYLMIINATRSSAEINLGLSFVPGLSLVDNWTNLTGKMNLFQGFFNSALISVSTTVLTLYVSALCAWGFAKYRFPGKSVLWAVTLGVIMIPNTLGIIGYYQWMSVLHLIDNPLALILPAGAASVTVFFLHQYIKTTISDEMLEAAQIDGANASYIFHRIALPLMTPGLATMGIFAFVGSWNAFLGPLIVLYGKDKLTLPLIISQLNSTAYKTDFGMVYMGIAITVVPILIAFSLLSRYIISGLASGGSKE